MNPTFLSAYVFNNSNMVDFQKALGSVLHLSKYN